MNKILKGEGFQNRYRFSGTLTTESPLHIGTGSSSNDPKFFSQGEIKKFKDEKKDPPEVSLIIKDVNNKPIIPGSSLRGVMRHWLQDVLAGFGNQWSQIRNYEERTLTELDQEEQIQRVKDFSWVEFIFGTPFHEGKIDIWDAKCATATDKKNGNEKKFLGWDDNTLTYVETSVAIDPVKGTAIDKLLYKYEVVPPGVKFEVDIVGQNLSDLEIGLVLLALEGFNSHIYPIQIGSKGGNGYGRVKYESGKIYGLSNTEVKDWLTGMLNKGDKSNDGGYYMLPELSEDKKSSLIKEAKSAITGGLQSSR